MAFWADMPKAAVIMTPRMNCLFIISTSNFRFLQLCHKDTNKISNRHTFARKRNKKTRICDFIMKQPDIYTP